MNGQTESPLHPLNYLKSDVERYGGWRALLREQSLWAVLWYRIGQTILVLPPPLSLLKKPVMWIWWFGFRLIEVITGVSIPPGAKVGPGIRIWHFGGVFINNKSVIGRRCTLRQGVTIGNRHEGGGAPHIGDDVDVGAYAQILGDVTVGAGAKIGAMSVVLTNVPDGATAVGVPARVLPQASNDVGAR